MAPPPTIYPDLPNRFMVYTLNRTSFLDIFHLREGKDNPKVFHSSLFVCWLVGQQDNKNGSLRIDPIYF